MESNNQINSCDSNNMNRISCKSNDTVTDSGRPLTSKDFLDINIKYPKYNCDCSINTSDIQLTKMKYEKFRIESYRNWPVPYIDVRELAKNGFYYTGYSDVVSCIFCHITICNWEADDNIQKEHNKWAPYCPFVRNLTTDNIKLIIKSNRRNSDKNKQKNCSCTCDGV